MEAKKGIHAILLSFLLVWLFARVFINHPPCPQAQDYLMGKLKNLILNKVTRVWPPEGNIMHHVTGAAAVSPNLSTCHHSLTDANHPINCCPPSLDSEQPLIDFQFPDLSTPIRIRRPAHHIDQDHIAKYNKALSIMKSLPYDDPRSLMRQANLHCAYCSGAYNQLDFNSILKVHGSWLFFPWHRMFIYFHERILGNLIGDDTFALPFWNWDNPDGMIIPEIYTSGSLVDIYRDISHLPPQVADINFDYVENGLDPEDQISSNLAFMYHQMVSGSKKTELFMGCPYKSGEEGFCNGPGTIELAPHNALHTWVGSSLNPEREDLGAFYSAARDPIFYAHHSNVDRLWEVWREIRGHNQEIMDPDWLDSYFFFYDQNSQLVRIKIRDVLDISRLRYTYKWVENPWIFSRPKPSVLPKLARNILNTRNNENGRHLSSPIVSPNFGPVGRALDTTIRVKVHRPKIQRSKKEKEEEEVLVVNGIDVKKDMYVKFDVYVNAVDENLIGPESREFAGTFVNMRQGVRLVGREGDGIVKRKAILKMGISELLEDLEADGDDWIWVTLVPRGGTGVNTTIDAIRIEYMK